jgi:hypothetical protein
MARLRASRRPVPLVVTYVGIAAGASRVSGIAQVETAVRAKASDYDDLARVEEMNAGVPAN